MRSQLTVYTIVLCITSVIGQEWFPVGATWYYTQPLWPHQGVEYRYFEVIGDTLIQDKACRIVTGYCECGEAGYGWFLHIDGDRVYSFHQDLNTFILLYDFTLEAGDTLMLFGEFAGDTKYVIDTVSTFTTSSGLDIRVQHFRSSDGWLEFGDRIFEFFGSNQCLYPQIGFCDPVTIGLRCYEDTIFGLISFMDPGAECDQVLSSVSTPGPKYTRVSPNPNSGHFTVASDRSMNLIEIIELPTGRVVFIEEVKGNFSFSSLIQFLPGAYLLRITLSDTGQEVHRILVY